CRDYAPDGADEGTLHTFTGEFTITDEMLDEFDDLVIGLVGSRRDGDVLMWDNISLRASGAGGDVPEPTSLAMMLMGAGFFGCHARKRRGRRLAEAGVIKRLLRADAKS
ncbi:MAG: PEP-CTERM sorting domain-containing protein, partial [Planctomycetota bacterium]